MLILVEDRTERLEREGELDRARTFLDAIIENIPMSIKREKRKRSPLSDDQPGDREDAGVSRRT